MEADGSSARSSDARKEESRVAEPANVGPKVGWLAMLRIYFAMIVRNTTIEPMLFLKMVAEGNFIVIGDTLEIDRICRVNLNFSEADCERMDDGNHTHVQVPVQKYQNLFNYHQSLMDSTIPILMIILIGPLTDKYGRKPAMILVLIGFIGLSIVYLMVYLNPSWPVEVLYLANVCVDFTGTWVIFNMAVYSYLADITDVNTRTKRMSVADAIWYFGGPIGTLMGGYVYRTYGYSSVFIVSGSLWVICLIYTILFVKESLNSNQPTPADVISVESRNNLGILNYILSPIKTLIDRPRRVIFHITTLIILKLGVFLVQGHQMYLWSRKVLRWDATKFSTWLSFDSSSHQIGMLVWVWLAEKINLHDCYIANGGLFSIMLWSVTLCLTNMNTWWLTVVASILGMLEASIEPAIRSTLTAIAGVGEEGKILTVLGVLESAMLSVDRSLYTYLYNSYVQTFPQINFVVQASIAGVLMVLMFLLKIDLSRNNQALSTPIIVSINHAHHS